MVANRDVYLKSICIWKVFSITFFPMYLYLYLLIEKTVILNTNTFYFKKVSLYEVYFWQVKVLHDVLMLLKFLKLMLLNK